MCQLWNTRSAPLPGRYGDNFAIWCQTSRVGGCQSAAGQQVAVQYEDIRDTMAGNTILSMANFLVNIIFFLYQFVDSVSFNRISLLSKLN